METEKSPARMLETEASEHTHRQAGLLTYGFETNVAINPTAPNGLPTTIEELQWPEEVREA